MSRSASAGGKEPEDIRHATLFHSEIGGGGDWGTRGATRSGAREAADRLNLALTLQEIIITRDGAGRVLRFGPGTVFAVFERASDALNRALEIQRVLDAGPAGGGDREGHMAGSEQRPGIRIGLHMGEVLLREGERVEIVSRHASRAFRVMEAAAPGRIYATSAVVEAGLEFVELPPATLAVEHYGEFYLKEVGATSLCEVADLRFTEPAPPAVTGGGPGDPVVLGRLELAGYRGLERRGEGPNGVVYRGELASTGEAVALKVLFPARSGDVEWAGRFEEENARAARLDGAGMGRVRRTRLDRAPAYYEMDWVEGKPLDEATRGVEPGRVAGVFRSVCELMEKAHRAGLIHGDLKPGNVRVTDAGEPVVLDFGFGPAGDAKDGTGADEARRVGARVPGVVDYASPEALHGERLGPGADVYSLGVMMYEALTGRRPFGGGSVEETVQGHLHHDPPLPSSSDAAVPDGLRRICLKALEKHPGDRYASMDAMRLDLERLGRGEMVRTRPTVYDNLLYHRVTRHAEQVREWARGGLLTDEEAHRLLADYEGLQRRGLPAVMEGHGYRLWQTLVYMGGWAVVNGALLWLVLHWATLGRAQKLLLGTVPAAIAFLLAAFMSRMERYRLTYVALLVGVLGVPLLFGVWFHELGWGSFVAESRMDQELFFSPGSPDALTNRQLWWALAATLGAAAAVGWHTRTTAHSAQAAGALFLAYSASLLFFDLKSNVMDERWAWVAVRYAPLAAILAGVAGWLLRRPERPYQAEPWIHGATLLLVLILYGVALNGLREWTGWGASDREPASYLMLTVFGATEAALGLVARQVLRHRGRLAVLGLIWIGLVNVLVGLGMAGHPDVWPEGWGAPRLLGQAVALPHVLMPLVSVGIALLACRFQMFSFLGVGAAGLAVSIHLLGELYFHEVSGWPKWIMALGVACFALALFKELKRPRVDAVEDGVSRSRL